MLRSIDFIYSKEQAIEKVREILSLNGINDAIEKEINNRYGLKFTFSQGKEFSIILYFKGASSSKIFFEKTTDDIIAWFLPPKDLPDEVFVDEPLYNPSVPIHASFKIKTAESQETIRAKILEMFSDAVETKPKETIFYKVRIEKNNVALTVTQFVNGTILLQGVDSSLVSDVLSIIQEINPITEKENALMYVPKNEQKAVAAAIDTIPNIFVDLYDEAKSRISQDAFEFLFNNDQQTLVSAIGILKAVKQTDLKIPLYNPVLYPFAKVFEGFIIRLMIEKCFFTYEKYQSNSEIAGIGNALREKKFEKYIKDTKRDGNIVDKLRVMWEDLRCHELHSDPAKNPQIINLADVQQVENRIGEISSSIMDGYRILVENGYTEAEMLALREKKTPAIKPDNIQSPVIKDIPKFDSHIGTDESGKGDYFGPLVIAGVFVNNNIEKKLIELGVQDSKSNSDSKNQELARKIKEILMPEQYSVVFISPEKYNQLYSKIKNLNKLLAWGHARAIENILKKVNCNNVISDQFGDEELIKKALLEQGKKATLIQTPKAERDIAVAAASILARDIYLQQRSLLGRQVGMALPKGASPAVEEAAHQIIKKYGNDILLKYVKYHFKTTEKILRS